MGRIWVICGVSRKGKGLLGFFWNYFGQGMNGQGWYKSAVLTNKGSTAP